MKKKQRRQSVKWRQKQRRSETQKERDEKGTCFLVAASSIRSFAIPDSIALVIPPSASTCQRKREEKRERVQWES